MSKPSLIIYCLIILVPIPVFADDIEDITARANYWGVWAESIGKADPDLMASLYDSDAILHGTGSPVVRRGTDLIREYFAGNGLNPPSMFLWSPCTSGYLVILL